jgi:hypothetical protein
MAQDNPVDERRAYIARDVCVGMGANFANAPDGGDISFQAGRFTVQRGRGTITIFEGAVKLLEMPGFTYQSYTLCLDRLIAGLESTRRQEDAVKSLEAFMAGYELADVLSVGTCMRSAAMGGYYVGDLESQGRPARAEYVGSLVDSVAKSVVRRVKRFSGQEIFLDLGHDWKLYPFYRDRAAPYFLPEDIGAHRTAVMDVASSREADYVNLGFVVGRMKRSFLYGTILSMFLQNSVGRFDDRAMRANTYFPPSLQCLQRGYTDDQSRLIQGAADLRLRGRLSVPNFDVAIVNGQTAPPATIDGRDTGASSASAVSYFDQRVTAKIRQELRDAR